MKSKLVKYPFNDKKYRWDDKEMGKTFEYKWDKSAQANFDTMAPYVEVEQYDPEQHSSSNYKLIDPHYDYGEHITYSKTGTPTNNSPYTMVYSPQENYELGHQATAKILLTNRERAYEEMAANDWDWVSKIYYTLTYTTEGNILYPKFKFYKDDAALHRDGLTPNEVGVFTGKMNIYQLCSLFFRYNNSNNFYWDGPYDTQQTDYFSPNYSGMEYRTSEGKYYYIKGAFSSGYGFWIEGTDNPRSLCNLENSDLSTLEDIIPDNTYTYSYGVGLEGTVKEYDRQFRIYGDQNHLEYGALPYLTMYYTGSMPSGRTNRYNLLPPDFGNGHFTGLYFSGTKQDYNINDDLTIPTHYFPNSSGTIRWCPRTLILIASLICRYTFNMSQSIWYRNFSPEDSGKESWTSIVYPQVPQEEEVYKALCFYRTPETLALEATYNNTRMTIDTPYHKSYLFKDRVFEYTFDPNGDKVPGRDWFIPDYTNDLKLSQDYVKPEDLQYPERFPLVENEMGWYRVWIYYGMESPRNWLDDSTNINRYVEIIGQSGKDIYPRFKDKDIVNDKEAGFTNITINSTQYNNQYPLSYFYTITDNTFKNYDFYIDNDNKIVNKDGEFTQKYVRDSSTRYHLNLTVKNKGIQFSNPVDKEDGTSHFDSWSTASWESTVINKEGIRFDTPFVAIGDEISCIENKGTYGNQSLGVNYYVPQITYAAGWRQIPTEEVVEGQDIVYSWRNQDFLRSEIKYEYGYFNFVDTTQVDEGVFDYYEDPININLSKYITTGKYVLKPNLLLIGDKTTDYVEVPVNSQDTFKYTLGEIVNNNFVAKNFQVNAPCEYENGVVSSKTWLTFNTYTANEWATGYHFMGDQWNCMSSPFAYLSNIKDPTGNRLMVYNYQQCPAGKYLNALKIVRGFEVNDSLDNSYISSDDYLSEYIHYWDDNVGGIWDFNSEIVSSTNRHEYPDQGSQGRYVYLLRPQDTKFLYYSRTDNLLDIELLNDRYTYPHTDTDYCDRSYEGTTTGDSTGTHEELIPDAIWRSYLGLYLGESIPFLEIEEEDIEPSEILGVPQYDKQVNTSDTLKYGTVSSASLSFVLNKPVAECMGYNNKLLVLYYDFTHTDDYERLGFFRIDTIEALDEYSTQIVAHDEVYRLNKYVDDFLSSAPQSTTLDIFYRDLLNYCNCCYDTHQPIIHNGTMTLSNVYKAVKTTGVQVAHYIAILVPGFIHADIDGDIQLSQYKQTLKELDESDYTNIVYSAYNTDMLDKIKITSSNVVKGQSTGNGIKTYYIADDPLLSELQSTVFYNHLANDIYDYYDDIPTYRPATVNLLVRPDELEVGEIVELTTPSGETYNIIVMSMNISGSGIQVKSLGTKEFPVEGEGNSEFVNLINDMGEISGDIQQIMDIQNVITAEVSDMRDDVDTNTENISSLQTTTGTHTTQISNLQSTVNSYQSSSANNLATITLQNTLNNVALKGYVDNSFTTADTNAQGYANTADTHAQQYANTALNQAKAYTDSIVISTCIVCKGTLQYKLSNTATDYRVVEVFYMGNNTYKNGIFIGCYSGNTVDEMYCVTEEPFSEASGASQDRSYYMMAIYNDWQRIYHVTFTPSN